MGGKVAGCDAELRLGGVHYRYTRPDYVMLTNDATQRQRGCQNDLRPDYAMMTDDDI
jgi:hypothetical protein